MCDFVISVQGDLGLWFVEKNPDVNIFGQAQSHLFPVLGIEPKHLLENLSSPGKYTPNFSLGARGVSCLRDLGLEKDPEIQLVMQRSLLSPYFQTATPPRIIPSS